MGFRAAIQPWNYRIAVFPLTNLLLWVVYFEYEQQIYVVVKEFESIGNINHILKVEKTNRIIMAPVNDIIVKYLYMKIGLFEYIASEPNPYEIEWDTQIKFIFWVTLT